MSHWLHEWSEAGADVVQEAAPYDQTSYQLYLQWYTPRTCTRILLIEDPPRPLLAITTALYPGHAGVALHMVVRIIINM